MTGKPYITKGILQARREIQNIEGKLEFLRELIVLRISTQKVMKRGVLLRGRNKDIEVAI